MAHLYAAVHADVLNEARPAVLAVVAQVAVAEL